MNAKNPAPAAQSTPAVFSANRDHGLHDACMDAHRETANALYDTRAQLARCVALLERTVTTQQPNADLGRDIAAFLAEVK